MCSDLCPLFIIHHVGLAPSIGRWWMDGWMDGRWPVDVLSWYPSVLMPLFSSVPSSLLRSLILTLALSCAVCWSVSLSLSLDLIKWRVQPSGHFDTDPKGLYFARHTYLYLLAPLITKACACIVQIFDAQTTTELLPAPPVRSDEEHRLLLPPPPNREPSTKGGTIGVKPRPP